MKKSTRTYRHGVSIPEARQKQSRTHHRAVRLELAVDHALNDLFDIHQAEALDLAVCLVRARDDPLLELEVVDVLDLRLDPAGRRAVGVAEERDAAECGLGDGRVEGRFLGTLADDRRERGFLRCNPTSDCVVEVRGPAGEK